MTTEIRLVNFTFGKLLVTLTRAVWWSGIILENLSHDS